MAIGTAGSGIVARWARLFTKISVKTRVYSGFGLILLLLAIVAATAVSGLRDGQTLFGDHARISDVTRTVMEVDRDIVELRRNVFAFAKTGDQGALARGVAL